mgnify:CR=1 FL=1
MYGLPAAERLSAVERLHHEAEPLQASTQVYSAARLKYMRKGRLTCHDAEVAWHGRCWLHGQIRCRAAAAHQLQERGCMEHREALACIVG